MTSRERILHAVRHKPTDRLPIDLGGTRQSGIAALAYARLRRQLRPDLNCPFKVFDVFQMLAEIEPEMSEHLPTDTVALNRPVVAFGIPNRDWKPWRLFDGTEVLVPGDFNPIRNASGDWELRRADVAIGQMPADGFYFDRLEKYPGALHPNLDSWSVPRLSEDELEHYARTARDLYTNTDRAIIAALGPPYELFNGIGQGGFEDWMITFASEPNYVADLYQILTDAWIENLQLLHQAVGPRLHILQICDDFGTQRAPFLSVQMFRERLLPAYKRGLDWIHTRTPWKVMLHSDGALYPLLPSIIEMGVDILNPVQTSAAGMDAKRLKSEFGDQLVFWGGSCDPQTTLRSGSPDAVAAETRANLEILSPGGGYVFAPVHNIQADVPPENILALIKTARHRPTSASA
ncbi:MAG: methyltransferase [Verrucomicrobia bacterium]|nr:methyltransferase [Verrucomicrobiota bacterium]